MDGRRRLLEDETSRRNAAFGPRTAVRFDIGLRVYRQDVLQRLDENAAELPDFLVVVADPSNSPRR